MPSIAAGQRSRNPASSLSEACRTQLEACVDGGASRFSLGLAVKMLGLSGFSLSGIEL